MKKLFTPQFTQTVTSKKTLLITGAIVVTIAVIIYIWQQQNPTTVSREVETEIIEAAPGELLSLDNVKDIAQSRDTNATEGQIATIELDEEHGIFIYKVLLTNGTVLYMNAKTGVNAAHHYERRASEQATDDTLTLPTDFAPGISFTEAKNIAMAKNPNATLERIKFEREHGTIVYSVRFTDDSRVDVNASNGKIVRTKDIGSDKRNDSNDDSSRSGSDDSGFDDSSSRRGSDD